MIELRNITKTYKSVVALNDISLKVEQGQFLTLLGPTGCGKSTLLRVVAGFEHPSLGDVLIDGKRINGTPPNQREVGLLFQNYALFPHLTVEGNVAFGLRMRGWKRAAIASKLDEVLSLLSVEHLRTRYPAQLSGGQQQRTALARTLAIEPKVLLLDEPLAALDRKLKLEMQVELKKLIARVGITTICVSHDQDEALTMSDTIALLNKGQIEQFGQPLELYDRPRSSFAASFLGNSNLITGVVRKDAGGLPCFQTGEFVLPMQTCAKESGSELTLMLRPEHLVLTEQSSLGSYPGQVSFVTQFGHSVQYEVKLDAGPIFLVSARREREVIPFSINAQVYLLIAQPSAYQIVQ